MKEVELKISEPVEQVKQVQAKKTKTIIGTMIPGDGHKLYEFNRRTYFISEVKPVASNTTAFMAKRKLAYNEVYIPHETTRLKFEAKDDCFYVYALNVKNAVKKIHKRFKNIPFVKEVIND